MAKVVDKFTGSLSGQLGDMVYRRYKNGSVFVARQKSVNTVSYSDKCINTRNNFKVAVAFAKTANTLLDIHSVWKNSSIEGRSPYTKILKANIGSVNDRKLPGVASKITPKGFGFNTQLISLSTDKICLNLSLPEFSKQFVNINFKLNFVLALYNPVIPDSETPFICIADSSAVSFPDFDNYHLIESDFGSMNRKTLSEYHDAVIFFALTNTENKAHIISGTYHYESAILD